MTLARCRSAVLLGTFDTQLTPTDESRNWNIDRKVKAIFDQLRSS